MPRLRNVVRGQAHGAGRGHIGSQAAECYRTDRHQHLVIANGDARRCGQPPPVPVVPLHLESAQTVTKVNGIAALNIPDKTTELHLTAHAQEGEGTLVLRFRNGYIQSLQSTQNGLVVQMRGRPTPAAGVRLIVTDMEGTPVSGARIIAESLEGVPSTLGPPTG